MVRTTINSVNLASNVARPMRKPHRARPKLVYAVSLARSYEIDEPFVAGRYLDVLSFSDTPVSCDACSYMSGSAVSRTCRLREDRLCWTLAKVVLVGPDISTCNCRIGWPLVHDPAATWSGNGFACSSFSLTSKVPYLLKGVTLSSYHRYDARFMGKFIPPFQQALGLVPSLTFVESPRIPYLLASIGQDLTLHPRIHYSSISDNRAVLPASLTSTHFRSSSSLATPGRRHKSAIGPRNSDLATRVSRLGQITLKLW